MDSSFPTTISPSAGVFEHQHHHRPQPSSRHRRLPPEEPHLLATSPSRRHSPGISEEEQQEFATTMSSSSRPQQRRTTLAQLEDNAKAKQQQYSQPATNRTTQQPQQISRSNDARKIIANAKARRMQRSANRKAQRKQAFATTAISMDEEDLDPSSSSSSEVQFETDFLGQETSDVVRPGAVHVVPVPLEEADDDDYDDGLVEDEVYYQHAASAPGSPGGYHRDTDYQRQSNRTLRSSYSRGNTVATATTTMMEDFENDSEQGEELVIAAELSQDLEREIEARIRQQVLEEAAHASVVVGHVVPPSPPPVRSGKSSKSSNNNHQHQHKIYLRTLLPWRIQQEAATRRWMATVQTNPLAKELTLLEQQRGERSFLAASKREAIEIAMSMATPRPRIVNDVDSPTMKSSCCALCTTNFGYFQNRRKGHCQNCGLGMLCAACSITWHKSMVPNTYYCHKESTTTSSTVNVCTACDWSARQFQNALLKGDLAEARYLYKHHNINLRTPYRFMDDQKKKKEILYPIHAAILGGNLKLVQWFVSNRVCPIKDSNTQQPLKTSKGRTPIQLAMKHLDILQFLVAQLNCSLDDLITAGDGESSMLQQQILLGHMTQLLKLVTPQQVSRDASTTTTTTAPVITLTDYERKRQERRKQKEQMQQQRQPDAPKMVKRGSF